MQIGYNKVNPEPSFRRSKWSSRSLPAENSQKLTFTDPKRRRARSERQGPSTQTKTSHKKDARCLITGDSAAESPVHLCYVLNECHWINHPMVSP